MPVSDERLAEIAAIRDEDIDTSDIPEGTAADFARAKVVRRAYRADALPAELAGEMLGGLDALAAPRGGAEDGDTVIGD